MAIGTILSALSLIKDLAPGIGKITEKFIDGKATVSELDAAAVKHKVSAEVQLALAQIKLNTEEAKSSSMFVAGWRPAVGWICAVAMGFNFVVFPLVGAAGLELDPLDLSTMMPVLLGMLGIGGLRSFEKMKGVSRSNLENF